MQDRFVGDIGDYGKYGLLRALCPPSMKLGIIWYFNDDVPHSSAGTRFGYLTEDPNDSPPMRPCDPCLFDALQVLVSTENRTVSAIEASPIFPRGTVFYRAPLSYGGLLTRQQRVTFRTQWFDGALDATRGCDLIFLDPDNGIAPPSIPKDSAVGIRYAYDNELSAVTDRSQSLIIYHHLSRRRKARDQITWHLTHLNEQLRRRSSALGLWYHRGGARVFFVLPTHAHRATIHERLATFALTSPWRQHVSLIDTPPPNGEGVSPGTE